MWNLVRAAIGTLPLGGTMLPTNDLSSRPFASLTCHRAVSHWPRLGESEEQVKECRSNTSLYSAHNSFVSWAQNSEAGEKRCGRMVSDQDGSRPRWVSRVPRHESGQAGRMPSTAALCVSDRPRPALEFGPRTSEKSFACNLWRLIGLRAALS